MYHKPYDHRSDYRHRRRHGSPDFWSGLDGDPSEPAIFDDKAKRWVVVLVLIMAGLGIAAALI